MTLKTCLSLLEAYKEKIDHVNADNDPNPVTDAQRSQSRKNFDMMKAHIITNRSFTDHPLLKSPSPKPKLEVKRDGKRR